jgi:hypothetical protein
MNLDLREILKDAPKGMELYSVAHGTVKLYEIVKRSEYPIGVKDRRGVVYWFTSKGQLLDFAEVETSLFPSKENRDWSTFKLPRWRAKDRYYYYVTAFGEVAQYLDNNSEMDLKIWKSGNYFQTEEKAKNSKIYKAFHDEES